jgi:hypothetical protein
VLLETNKLASADGTRYAGSDPGRHHGVAERESSAGHRTLVDSAPAAESEGETPFS